MLAGHSAPRLYTRRGRIHLLSAEPNEGSVSRPLSTQALYPVAVEFTYFLQNRMRTVLAGHLAPGHYTRRGRIHLLPTEPKEGSFSRPLRTPSRSNSLTLYSSKEGQCQPTTQRPGTTPHLDRILLLATAAKEGSVSRRLSTPSRLNSLTSYRTEGGQC